LRHWFAHDPDKWLAFRRRYFAELAQNPQIRQELAKAARRRRVTLIYSSRDAAHNSALAMRDYLQAELKREAQPKHPNINSSRK
jgi:uncharacterized protein YeaO (DUF488 family)